MLRNYYVADYPLRVLMSERRGEEKSSRAKRTLSDNEQTAIM